MKKILISIFVLLGIVTICLLYRHNKEVSFQSLSESKILSENTKRIEDKGNSKNKEDEKNPKRVSIYSVGDVIFHQIMYLNTQDGEGNYSFNHMFEDMKDFFADRVVIGNYETTSNPNRKWSGYPMFNTPPQAIKALKESGFDVLTTANNHCMDTGAEGIATTIEELEKSGLAHTGTFKSIDDTRGIIFEKNGIKIGIIAYSEMFNGNDCSLKKEQRYMINPLDKDKIRKDIEDLKVRGADFIIAYPHFGNEYQVEPTDSQKFWAKFLLEEGADIVIGSHPHVPQKCEAFDFNGKEKYVVYSLGNFISNQNRQSIGKKLTEVGSGIELNLIKDDRGTRLENFKLNPIYTSRFRNDKGYFEFRSIDLNKLIEKTEDANMKKSLLELKDIWTKVVEITNREFD